MKVLAKWAESKCVQGSKLRFYEEVSQYGENLKRFVDTKKKLESTKISSVHP